MAERRVAYLLLLRVVGTNRTCIVRGKSSVALLFVLAVAALVPSLGFAQYAPKWHVGDWWVTKTFGESPGDEGPEWSYRRYEVVRVAQVGKQDCFVLMARTQGSNGALERDTTVLYVRADDWLVIREEIAHSYGDKPCPRIIRGVPLGLFGPDEVLKLPRFPLRLGDTDTTFKLTKRDDGMAELREISSIADSASVKRLLDDGDSADGRVVRPEGVVYQVRNELGGDVGPDPFSGQRRVVQSLQLWSEDQPWRVYEELVHYYTGPKPVRRVVEQTWLIAAGHKEK